MKLLCDALKRACLLLVLVGAFFLSAGCATTGSPGVELPPILAPDEILRPYQKVASIEVRRERYGSPNDLTPDDYDWAYLALRREGARIGADAVITPEVRVELHRYLLFPVSEMKARGIAVKFQ
jgi:hypothetical protein